MTFVRPAVLIGRILMKAEDAAAVVLLRLLAPIASVVPLSVCRVSAAASLSAAAVSISLSAIY